jgi:hypothetical protein
MGKKLRVEEVEYFFCDICGEECGEKCHSFHRVCEVCSGIVCPQATCHETSPFVIFRACHRLSDYLAEWYHAWDTLHKSQEEILGRWRDESIKNLNQGIHASNLALDAHLRMNAKKD